MAKKTKKNIAKKTKKKQVAKPVEAVEQVTVELTPKEIKAQEKAEEKAKKLADKEYQQKKKAKEKAENPGFFARTGNYFKSTWVELKKVKWLNSEELMKSTGAVAGIVTVFTVATWVADSALGAVASLILGI